jgi:rhodanese-related sulfurtransferase
MPWDAPVTLLGETAEDVAEAQRELVRVGIDRPAAMATGKPEDWAGDAELARFPQATFADLAAELAGPRPPVVLDVRRDQERAERFVDGSVHIPIHEVLDRIEEIPDGQVWVHCAGGYRAGVVAALLDARGRDVVAVDDSFDNAGPAGLPLTTPQEIPA